MRSDEFCRLETSDIENTGNRHIVTIRDTKTDCSREFIIGNEFYHKVNQYASLRPQQMEEKRFFLSYRNGECRRQVIGKNKISSIPRSIATYLNCPDVEKYTGHCFRRTSATLLANNEPSTRILMQHGGWKSDAVARSYVENSLETKIKIFQKIVSTQNEETSTEKSRLQMPTTSTKTSSSGTSHPPTEDSDSAIPRTSTENSKFKDPHSPITNLKCTSNKNFESLSSQNIDLEWGDDFDAQLLENFDSIFLENSQSERSSSPIKRFGTEDPPKSPKNSNSKTSSAKRPLASIENLHSPEKSKRPKNENKSQRESIRRGENKKVIQTLAMNDPKIKLKNCNITNLTINYNYCQCKHNETTNN